MTHLLLDVDSKIPNLALMKISAWLKSKGETVHLVKAKEKFYPFYVHHSWVWISCVFTWNRALALRYEANFRARGMRVKIGGGGVDLKVKLPSEIEALVPDYSLYGDDRAIGFVIRGCIRRCDFCLVSKKEGKITDNPYRPVETWVPDGFNKVLLLDNEFAAFDPEVYPKIQRDIEAITLNTIRERKWKYSITQGYDLRCVNKRKAEQLARHKPKDLHFTENRLTVAWDYLGIEPFVRQGLRTLLDAGFKGREIMCYCLVGQRSTHLEDVHRFKVLWREFGVLPFLMRYRPLDGSSIMDDPFLNAFCRYVNRGPVIYRNHSFPEYCKERAPTVFAEAERLWN